MPWRTVTNKLDCGVFAMRHMETYMGQSVKVWDVGLTSQSKVALKHLRVRYCRQLVSSGQNILDEDVFNRARAYFAKHCKDKSFDLDKFIEEQK